VRGGMYLLVQTLCPALGIVECHSRLRSCVVDVLALTNSSDLHHDESPILGMSCQSFARVRADRKSLLRRCLVTVSKSSFNRSAYVPHLYRNRPRLFMRTTASEFDHLKARNEKGVPHGTPSL
jgi:hypothetical protein